MNKLMIYLIVLAVLGGFNGISAQRVSDEDLYKKAVTLENAVSDMDLHIKKLAIELSLMVDVLKGLPTRMPASEIPINPKGKPVVDIDGFKESMSKVRKKELNAKINDHRDEISERNKTLTRLKNEREEIFNTIRTRVKNMR